MRDLPTYLIAFGSGVLLAVVAVAAAAWLRVGLAVDIMAGPWFVPMTGLAGVSVFAGALMLLRGRW